MDNNNCQLVVFSDKAYNAIIRETFEWDPVETGGILLGHILDNGCWIVMEVLPPGYGEGREGDNVFHEYGYFEYNRKFVNYLAKSVAGQYEIPLELLGLWHRHPGSMDYFSGTDDVTNSTFAAQNPHGVISGLINIDPQLRMTMYHLAHGHSNGYERPPYQQVDVEVGSDLIPEEYFKLKYYQGEEKDLHPYAPQRNKKTWRAGQEEDMSRNRPNVSEAHTESSIDAKDIINKQLHRNSNTPQESNCRNAETHPITAAQDLIEKVRKHKKGLLLIVGIAFICLLFSVKDNFTKGLPFIQKDDVRTESKIDSDDDNDKDESKQCTEGEQDPTEEETVETEASKEHEKVVSEQKNHEEDVSIVKDKDLNKSNDKQKEKPKK